MYPIVRVRTKYDTSWTACVCSMGTHKCNCPCSVCASFPPACPLRVPFTVQRTWSPSILRILSCTTRSRVLQVFPHGMDMTRRVIALPCRSKLAG